ncbi:MAG: LemA family protein [Eubacterium sp.]|nr:LemA family protein [Eubacterium sp.]
MLVILGVILIIALCIVIWYVGTSNRIRMSDMKISEALSGIDIALTKRHDVLMKMMDSVKAFQQYEADTFTKLVGIRMGMSMKERKDANRDMDKLSSEIRLLVENYPELKSRENYVALQRSIVDVEEHLQASRRLYNSNVTAYNRYIITFPSSIVAGMMGAIQKQYFEAENYKREDVQLF